MTDIPASSKPTHTRTVFFAYIWHGFFLALTMSMLDLNTVFPSLVAELTDSKILFGILYAIMLGAPLVFNLVFSHYLRARAFKKKFLLIGIFMRASAFLGMAVSTRLFGVKNPAVAVYTFFAWVFLFSISAGFAGIAYADVMGKLLPGKQRTQLYTTKQLFSSIAAFAGGLLIARLFRPGAFVFPNQYVISLLIGGIGLAFASIGFFLIREPASSLAQREKDRKADSLLHYVRNVPQVLKNDASLRKFILVENLASFSVMILPFYMIYARETFGLSQDYIGRYLLIQVSGTILSNVLWGYLATRSNAQRIVRTCVSLGALIPLVALTLARTSPDAYGIVFFLVGFIISGRRIGFEAYILDIAPEQQRTEYLGIRGTLNIFIVILPILGGALISLLGYVPVFLTVSAIMLFSSYLAGTRQDA